MRACLDLAQRVHARYPHVLIEMHDMLAGGSTERMTPVYYKYGLPGSYDDNWGFELMWDPMADLKSGRARTLYDYNLGCNVPVYLHIDLRKDNEHCVVLWWYASTCRHLGIGGTHKRPEVVRAQQEAMRRYRELDRFYKRGDFFGINEEIHVHALQSEQAMVVNVFNLSAMKRKVGGKIALRDLGLDPARSYSSSEPWARVDGGELQVDRADAGLVGGRGRNQVGPMNSWDKIPNLVTSFLVSRLNSLFDRCLTRLESCPTTKIPGTISRLRDITGVIQRTAAGRRACGDRSKSWALAPARGAVHDRDGRRADRRPAPGAVRDARWGRGRASVLHPRRASRPDGPARLPGRACQLA